MASTNNNNLATLSYNSMRSPSKESVKGSLARAIE
jgi:hypothetical protein